MEKREPSGGRSTSTDSALQNLLNRVFRCRHRRKTFPFTPRGEDQCYAVCLDCGQRLGSDFQEIGRALKPDNASLQQPAGEKAHLPSPLAKVEVRAPFTPPPAVNHSPSSDLQLRNWKYDLLWIGLFVVGLSGGLYLTDRIRQSAAQSLPPEHRLVPIACNEPPIATPKSDAPAPPALKPVAQATGVALAPPPTPVRQSPVAEAATSQQTSFHLVSRSSVAILGLEASAVADLSEHPGRLTDLIQSGSLFTVPSGSAIEVREAANGVLKVEILGGSMAGREGWARASQVMPRYRLPGQSHSRELRQGGEH